LEGIGQECGVFLVGVDEVSLLLQAIGGLIVALHWADGISLGGRR